MMLPLHRLHPSPTPSPAACRSAISAPAVVLPAGIVVAAALLAAVAVPGARAEPAKAPLRAVVFAVEPVGLPGTAAMRDKLDSVTALLRKLVADRGYSIVDTAPQAKEIADKSPLSQCNGCDQRIAEALGADIEIATALQAVSAATYSLSGSVKDVHSDRVLRQGVVDVRGEDSNVWAHGIKFLTRERLFEPPLPVDAAALAASVAAGKEAGK